MFTYEYSTSVIYIPKLFKHFTRWVCRCVISYTQVRFRQRRVDGGSCCSRRWLARDGSRNVLVGNTAVSRRSGPLRCRGWPDRGSTRYGVKTLLPPASVLHLAGKRQDSSSSRCTVMWATNQLGNRRLGDNLTGRQPTGRHILVNWATTLEECFTMHM